MKIKNNSVIGILLPSYNREGKFMTDYVVVDLETTGFSSDINDIIEIGAYKIVNGVAIEQFNTLVRPKCYIPRNIETMTGITNEEVKGYAHIEEVWPKFYEWQKGFPLLGHNLGFDYEFLCKNGKILGIDFTETRTKLGIDTLKLARKYLSLKSNKLSAVAENYGVQLQTDEKHKYHRASYDAYVTKLIYDNMLEQYGNIPDIKTPEFLTVEDKRYGKVVNEDVLTFY